MADKKLSLKEKALRYLKSNPRTEKVFGTADGNLFLKEQDAKAHARTLEKKNVSKFSQADVEDAKAKADEDAKVKAEADAKAKADKEAKAKAD